MGNPSASIDSQVKALKNLADAAGSAVRDLQLDGPGAERFRSALVACALDTLDLSEPGKANVKQALTSAGLTGVEDALTLGKSPGPRPRCARRPKTSPRSSSRCSRR